MKQRWYIRRLIGEAWEQSIQNDYSAQRINSERTLQASFWSHLNQSLPRTRRLFIEPTITLHVGGKIKKIIPDVVVCNTQQVIAIIELKFTPRTRPRFEKDIANMALLARHRQALSISNQRYRGVPSDEREYSLSEKVLFVWAGIHAGGGQKQHLFAAAHPELKGAYLQLHAATKNKLAPEIYSIKG